MPLLRNLIAVRFLNGIDLCKNHSMGGVNLEKVIFQTGGAEVEAGELKNKILYSKDTMPEGNKKYFISNNGNDENDGLSPDTPIKSYKRLADIELCNGDSILFERNSVFRFSDMLLIECDNIFIGAYGQGKKPLICGSVKNYAHNSLWTQTENPNIWITKVPISARSAGSILFNNDEFVGCWRLTKDSLKNDGDFYNDNQNGIVYLYFSAGNPGDYFESIEISSTMAAFRACYVDGLYIENLAVKYFTFGAFHISESDNVSVTNCIAEWIGGGIYRIDSEANVAYRYGNAFQVWHLAKNITVKNCWFNQIYDAALTFQGFGKEPANFVNITFENNLIEYCSMNIEFWAGKIGVDRHLANIENILYKENIIRFAGYGWAGRQRIKKDNQAALLGWNYIYENMKNFIITGNIIDCADCHMIYTKLPTEQKGLRVFANTYYQKQTSGVNDFVEIIKGLKIMPLSDKDFKNAILKFDEAPNLVKWLD